MFTFDDAPWVEYLEIDEETRQRKLRDDTPEEIREKYIEHCNNQAKMDAEPRPK